MPDGHNGASSFGVEGEVPEQVGSSGETGRNSHTAGVVRGNGLNLRFPPCYSVKGKQVSWGVDMDVTREELQQAGASPELARILAERLPRRGTGDLARHPMAVALAGIALAAFLGTLGWLVLGVSDTQTEVKLLQKDVVLLRDDVALLQEGQARIEKKVDILAAEIAEIKDLIRSQN